MILQLILAGTITLAAVSSIVISVREAQFSAGTPFTGVFAVIDPDAPRACNDVPREQVIGFTPTAVDIVVSREWWHGGGARYRAVFLHLERPALMIRAQSPSGQTLELIVERKRDGFELVNEEVAWANGDRTRLPRRAQRPNFFPCPVGTNWPWSALL